MQNFGILVGLSWAVVKIWLPTALGWGGDLVGWTISWVGNLAGFPVWLGFTFG